MLYCGEGYFLITRGNVLDGPSGAGSSVKRRQYGSKPGTGPTSTASATGSTYPARQSKGRIQPMRRRITRTLLAAAAADGTPPTLRFSRRRTANTQQTA